jgi:putative nucleotidyltransferase with HDIG domain
VRAKPWWVFIGTTFVIVVPAVVVEALNRNGTVTNVWVCLGLSVALAIAASFAGSALWERRRRKTDALFSELLVWGWLRRKHIDRQVARSLAALDRLGASGSVEERTTVLKRLAVALDAKDPYLSGHSRRVARHATAVAQRMGCSGEEVRLTQTAAELHDIGKIDTPPEILYKPGPLTESERKVMQHHAVVGAEMVAALGDPALSTIVGHHHERIDGAGYPDGLAGEEIPLGSRIVAVADTFDAIVSERPYREGAPDRDALDVLRQNTDTQLDHRAVDAFIAYYSDRGLSAFFSGLLTSAPRTDGLRTLRTALVSAATAGIVATAAVAATPAPASQSAQAPAAAAPAPANAATTSTGATSSDTSAGATSSSPGTTSASPPPAGASTTASTATNPTAPTSTPSATTPPSTPPPTQSGEPPALAPAPALPLALPCEPNCEEGPPVTTPTWPITTPPPTTSTSTPPATTTTAATTTATSTSTTTATTTRTSTSTSTSSTSSTSTTPPTTTPTPDPCKHGGWKNLGYQSEAECERALQPNPK